MAYLIKPTPKSKHSVIAIVLESGGDAGELAFFLKHGIEAVEKEHPHLNKTDPERLHEYLDAACKNSGP